MRTAARNIFRHFFTLRCRSLCLCGAAVCGISLAASALPTKMYVQQTCILETEDCSKKIDERKFIDGLALQQQLSKNGASVSKNTYTQATPWGLEKIVEVSSGGQVLKYLKKDGSLLSFCKPSEENAGIDCLELTESPQ